MKAFPKERPGKHRIVALEAAGARDARLRPDRRREGIATRLVELGEERLRAKGAPKTTALVGRGDTQAEELWRAAGYRDDSNIGRWVRSL